MHPLPRGHRLAGAGGGRIAAGHGRPQDLDLLDSVAGRIGGRTICALGDAAAMPVQSFLKHYRNEFVHLIEHGNDSRA